MIESKEVKRMPKKQAYCSLVRFRCDSKTKEQLDTLQKVYNLTVSELLRSLINKEALLFQKFENQSKNEGK